MALSPKKYLAWCLSLTLGTMAATGLFNYAVDPCGIYHADTSWDWIPSRPTMVEQEMIYKAHAVTKAQADILFLGNSHTAEGLDPHSPELPGRAYNLAIHHGTVYEAWRYLQHACAAHVPQTVVAGADLVWFNPTMKTNASFEEDRLLVQPDGQPTPTFTYLTADVARTLFSLSTLHLSLEVLFAPREPRFRFDAGYDRYVQTDIEHLDLAEKVRAANKTWVFDPVLHSFRMPDGSAFQMDCFDHIVALCAEKHIHLIVFVHPLHALLLDKCTDDWAGYCDWMKTLTAHLESNPALHGELWDFSSYNSITTEAMPTGADKISHMRYYWEANHYRTNVGDMVLRRIFTGEGPASFGQLVTTANVDQDLQRLLHEKQAWHDHAQAVPIEPLPTELGQAANASPSK